MRKILVLGSNSFSGSSLIAELLMRDYEIFALSRSTEVPNCYKPYREIEGKFHFIGMGSNFDVNRVVKLCESNGISKIVNFLAQSMVGQSWVQPRDWYQTNCVWLSDLVSTLNQWGGVSKFIQFSTPEVYGSTSNWQPESNKFNPSTPYALSRATGDQHLKLMNQYFGFPVIFTRTANIYGPYQPRYRIIPKAIISFLTNEKVRLHGGGTSRRSFIFNQDVAIAVYRILEEGHIGETYHISTQVSHSILEVVEMIAEAMNVDLDQIVEVVDERLGKDQAYLLDSRKIRSELAWNENIELHQGLMKTIDWAKSYIDSILNQPPEYLHRS